MGFTNCPQFSHGLHRCVRMCVKSLVDKAAIEPVCDEDANLQNFCTVMEHIMLHRYEGIDNVPPLACRVLCAVLCVCVGVKELCGLPVFV